MPLEDTDDLQILSLQEFAASSLAARFLKSGLNASALRTNNFLLPGDWEAIDRRVVAVSATILNGIADLRAAGLTIATGGLGAMLSLYARASDMGPASVNMSPDVDIEEDRIDYQTMAVPVPIIAKAFRINIRELAASRANGGGLDTSHADTATRKVAEKQEEMLFKGSPTPVQGNPIYGYLNHPDRNTVSGADWATPTNIYANVLSAIAAINSDGYTEQSGRYRLYLHSDQYTEAMNWVPNTAQPIMNTLLQLPGFGPGSIKIAQTIPSGQGVLVNLNSNVVDLAVGQDTLPVEWDTRGGMVTRYLIFSCLVPRVKSTYDKKSGIAHLSGI